MFLLGFFDLVYHLGVLYRFHVTFFKLHKVVLSFDSGSHCPDKENDSLGHSAANCERDASVITTIHKFLKLSARLSCDNTPGLRNNPQQYFVLAVQYRHLRYFSAHDIPGQAGYLFVLTPGVQKDNRKNPTATDLKNF